MTVDHICECGYRGQLKGRVLDKAGEIRVECPECGIPGYHDLPEVAA